MGLVSKCLATFLYVLGWCALVCHTKGNTESRACQMMIEVLFLVEIARNDDLWYHSSRQEYCIGQVEEGPPTEKTFVMD